jgi:hypothetical protein
MRRNRHGDKSRWVSSLSLTASGLVLIAGTAVGQDAPVPDPDQSDSDYSLHGQFTNVTQFHPAFTSPYRGANSLDPGNRPGVRAQQHAGRGGLSQRRGL